MSQGNRKARPGSSGENGAWLRHRCESSGRRGRVWEGSHTWNKTLAARWRGNEGGSEEGNLQILYAVPQLLSTQVVSLEDRQYLSVLRWDGKDESNHPGKQPGYPLTFHGARTRPTLILLLRTVSTSKQTAMAIRIEYARGQVVSFCSVYPCLLCLLVASPHLQWYPENCVTLSCPWGIKFLYKLSGGGKNSLVPS